MHTFPLHDLVFICGISTNLNNNDFLLTNILSPHFDRCTGETLQNHVTPPHPPPLFTYSSHNDSNNYWEKKPNSSHATV